jgi:hypothetical protein
MAGSPPFFPEGVFRAKLSSLRILAAGQVRESEWQKMDASVDWNRPCCKRADMFNKAGASRARPVFGRKGD